jgi:UDP-N-acetylglucosamine diphosphorylase/glucosamine-1-phosphate N-acetyltransferase
MIKQAVILAAGEGQRLRPFTVNKPKVMLSVADKPVLGHVIEALVKNGIRDIAIVVGYQKEHLLDHFGSGESYSADITYIEQASQLGTAHALARAKRVVTGDFLLLSGDTLIEAATIADFCDAAPTSLLVKHVANPERYGTVRTHGKLVAEITEKPEQAPTNTISTGIYAFNRDVFDYIGPELDIPDVINRMIADGVQMQAQETHGAWLDIVYPWDILSLNEHVLRQKPATVSGVIEAGVTLIGAVTVGQGSVIRAGCYLAGPLIIGAHCEIGPHASLRGAVSLGDNVTIGAFTELSNCVVGNDVSVGALSVVQDSVIDAGCIIQPRFTAASAESVIGVNGEEHKINIGAIIGEGCRVEPAVMAMPGTMLGNYSRVSAARTIQGILPDGSLVY